MFPGIEFDEQLDAIKQSQVVASKPDPSEPDYYKDLLRLGTQSLTQRQEEITRFQTDVSRFCIFTFKAGGVGLSLHQNKPEYRVRDSLVAPTYSAVELVQGFGRGARLTSCSDTIQTMVFYKATIEEDVALLVSKKLKCLRHITLQKESWEDIITDTRVDLHEHLVIGKEVESDIDEVGQTVDEEEGETE